MTGEEDEIDEELGAADPDATGQAALETLAQAPPAAAAPAVAPPAVPGQPAPAPAAAPVVAPPTMVPAGTHPTKGVRTVSALQPNADMAEGQAAERKVFQDEKKLAADAAELEGKKAQIEQERAEAIAEETARQNAAIEAEQQHQADLAAQRAEQFSRDLNELRRSKPPGGFTEWAGGKRATAALSIAIGGLVAGRAGTANLALADVNREVEQEQRRYQIGIETQFRALAQQQGLNHELDSQAKDALARAQTRKILALDSLNKYADAQLKALGIPAAQQAGIKAQLGLDKQAAEAQQKYGQILAAKVEDATHFAPGKGGAGAGGSDAVTKLVQMAENGAKRSEIVAAAAKAKIPEKLWKNQVDLAFVEREKGEAAGEKRKAAKEVEDAETEVLDFHGNPMGNTPAGRSGHALASEARKRTGNAQALVAQIDEAIRSVERDGKVLGVGDIGTEAYKERVRLLAGVQAKARAFSELPSSEGGLHLEHQQIGSANTASAKQLKALREDVINQTNLKNRSLITAASRAAHEGGAAEGGGAAAPEVRVTKDGRVLMKGADGKVVQVGRAP